MAGNGIQQAQDGLRRNAPCPRPEFPARFARASRSLSSGRPLRAGPVGSAHLTRSSPPDEGFRFRSSHPTSGLRGYGIMVRHDKTPPHLMCTSRRRRRGVRCARRRRHAEGPSEHRANSKGRRLRAEGQYRPYPQERQSARFRVELERQQLRRHRLDFHAEPLCRDRLGRRHLSASLLSSRGGVVDKSVFILFNEWQCGA
jgi:hypothetical protein